MARPALIKDETILEAARDVFLERGFLATTAEVADRAKVSEGTVFKRFKSKEDLFRAAMADKIAAPAWIDKIAGRVGTGDVHEHLIAMGLEMIAFFRTIMPLMMMSWSNPSSNGLPNLMNSPNPPPIRALKQLSAYFAAEMKLGRIHKRDPEIAARMFLGSINHYVFIEVLHRANDELPLPEETYIRGLVSIFWGGVAPASHDHKTNPR